MKPTFLVLALVPLLLASPAWTQTPPGGAIAKTPLSPPAKTAPSPLVLPPGTSSLSPPPPVTPAPAPAPLDFSKASLEADPTLETLKKLKPEDVEKVRKNVNDASNFVGGIRLFEALQKLAEAEALAPDLFMIQNLKGAVFTKMRLFEKARASFERATAMNPGSFHPKFNLAEIEFVEAAAKTRKNDPAAAAQWAAAQHRFEELLKGDADDPTKKLIEFKVTICRLQQGKTDQASAMIQTFSYIDDEPIYWMSQAAAAFQKGDKVDAQSWIASANNIWAGNPQAVSVYLDSFIELGWVESLAL